MPKFIKWLIVIVVIGVPVGYAVHLWRNYEEIQKSSREKAGEVATPVVDGESVSEIGYIYEMRRVNYIRDGYFTFDWFIAIPSTGDRLGCGYLFGSPDFKVGDGVTIVHNIKKLDEANVGYVIGLHDKRNGKVAKVACDDLEVMELLRDSEDQ